MPGNTVSGYCIKDIDPKSMKKIDKYEAIGILYNRKTVRAQMGGKDIKSEVYLANITNLRRHFGDNLDMTVILQRVQEYLEHSIGEFIDIAGTPESAQTESKQKKLYLRAKKELLGAEVKYLVDMYLLDQYVSNFTIKQELSVRGIPVLTQVRQNEELLKYAPVYMAFAMRHILLNQIEDKIRSVYRFQVFNKNPYHVFSISLLAVLKFLNRREDEMRIFTETLCRAENIMKMEYLDFAVEMIKYADDLYSRNEVEIEYIIREIERKKSPGATPLGIELEFSNMGKYAVEGNSPTADPKYYNFRHFYDFDLLRRAWKLGGYVDDHRFSLGDRKNFTGGFMEYAIGKNTLLEDTANPVTDDPWILGELIREITAFTSDVAPHSLHISLEYNKPIDWKKKNIPEYLICLLILGGDLKKNFRGDIVEKRIADREIVDKWGTINFILQNHHYTCDPDYSTQGSRVMEYQFLRLVKNKDYIPLILALKGFLIEYNPRPFLSRESSEEPGGADYEMEVLEKWSGDAYPISDHFIDRFLEIVEKGLMTENKGKRMHKKKFIEDNVFEIERMLKTTNSYLKRQKTS